MDHSHHDQPNPKPPTVVMIPSPGMGHLIPMIEFAKRLIIHNLSVAFVVPTDSPPSKPMQAVFNGLPPSISHTFLPSISLSDLPDNGAIKIETIISLTVVRSLNSLRTAFHSLSATHNITAVVVDLFGTDAFDIAREFGVPPFIFFPSTAMALSLFLHLPKLDEAVQCEYRELTEPVRIPGCIPVHGSDLLDPVQERTNEAYKWVLYHTKRYRLAEGIIENSFMELEPGAIKTLQKTEPGCCNPPVYPFGPLVNMDNVQSGVNGAECLKWLDEQPRGSVLFVSFGSGGTLTTAQINELAHGLEMSEQRFLWVVRSPNDGVTNANFFNVESQTDPYSFLPKGFVGRVKGRGLLLPSWAPQAQVLRHGSTGGFLSHCGWNSILESVVNGVPLVAWPLYAEQRMNAVMVTEDVKVAVRPKVSEQSGLVERHEIAKVVKDLMEGEDGKKLRYRMKDLKEAADKALSDSGSSTKNIAHLATMWKNKSN